MRKCLTFDCLSVFTVCELISDLITCVDPREEREKLLPTLWKTIHLQIAVATMRTSPREVNPKDAGSSRRMSRPSLIRVSTAVRR